MPTHQRRKPLTVRTLLLLLAFLVSYGSLYPFGFQADDASWPEFFEFATDWSIRTSRGDFIANVLLFAPIGFVGLLASRREGRRRVPLSLTVAIALLLALALQVAQLWVPGRSPEVGDAVVNAIGLALGMAVAHVLGRFGNQTVAGDRRSMLAAPLLLALLWIAYRWFPLVPTLDLQNLKDALKPLLLTPSLDPTRVLINAAGWLAWMLILLRCQIRGLGTLAIGIAAVIVVALQPLFVGNGISANNVAGLVIALALLPALRHPKAAPSIALLLLITLLANGLHPYRFSPWTNSFEWLPFAGFLRGSMEGNAVSLIFKCYFYGSTLFLMRLSGAQWKTAAITLAIWLSLIEAAQIHVVGRTAEITDPLLALILGYALSRLNALQSPHRPARTC